MRGQRGPFDGMDAISSAASGRHCLWVSCATFDVLYSIERKEPGKDPGSCFAAALLQVKHLHC
jgi:hypothetical protein